MTGESRDLTLQEQLSALRQANLAIEQSPLLTAALRSIAQSRDEIIRGVNEDDGAIVVDTLECHLPSYLAIANEESLFTETIQTLNISERCPMILPTFLMMRECLKEFVTMASEKNKLEDALNASCGSVVNDYLQGNPLLRLVENVANACAKFEMIRRVMLTGDAPFFR